MRQQFACTFVGSFYGLNQLPRDRRPQLAVAGRSNVGKSSLLNKLVGQKKLAKVSATPGKTRALNFFLADDRFYIVDLPGYGYARVSKDEKKRWSTLLEEYLSTAANLAGLCILLDSRREVTPEDLQLLEWMAHRGVPALGVLTKVDKLSRSRVDAKLRQLESEFGLPMIPFSVVTGVGKVELARAVRDVIEAHYSKINQRG